MAKGGKSGGDSGIGRSGGDFGRGKGDSAIGKGSSDSGTSKAAGDSGIERGGKGNPSSRSRLEGNMEAAKVRRMENTETAPKEVPKGGLEGNVEAAKSKRMEASSQPLPKGGLEGNMNAAKVRRSGEVTSLPTEGKETKEQPKEIKEQLKDIKEQPEVKTMAKTVEIAAKASENPAAVSKEAGEAAAEAVKNPETLKGGLEEGFKKQEQVISSDSTDAKRVESMRSMIKDMFSRIGKRKEGEAAAPELTEAQKLEKDRETVSKLLEENASIKELSKSERDAVINVGISNAIEKHTPNVSQERIEKMKSSIEMVDLETVKKQTGLDDDNARRILGYYSARTDKMSINVDSSRPEVSSLLATINHESLHMMLQQLDENGKPVIENRISMTGVKRSDMQDGNVGMNEGITEMYSIRDMEEINPAHKSRSYQNEVAVMREFEKVTGEELLHQAYMEGKPELLEQDYDSVMGNGMFKQFCETMDDLHWAESNNDASGTYNSVIRENRRQLEEWTKEYQTKKEEAMKHEENN